MTSKFQFGNCCVGVMVCIGMYYLLCIIFIGLLHLNLFSIWLLASFIIFIIQNKWKWQINTNTTQNTKTCDRYCVTLTFLIH